MKDYEMYLKDDAMLYEMLLRKAYHCGRSGDPFSLADTDAYFFGDKKFLPLEPLVGIWTALKLIKRQIDENHKHRKELSNLMDGLFVNRTRKKCHDLLVRSLEICHEHKIDEFPHTKLISK